MKARTMFHDEHKGQKTEAREWPRLEGGMTASPVLSCRGLACEPPYTRKNRRRRCAAGCTHAPTLASPAARYSDFGGIRPVEQNAKLRTESREARTASSNTIST